MMIGKLAIPYSKRRVQLFVTSQYYFMFFVIIALQFNVIMPRHESGVLSKDGADGPSIRLSVCPSVQLTQKQCILDLWLELRIWARKRIFHLVTLNFLTCGFDLRSWITAMTNMCFKGHTVLKLSSEHTDRGAQLPNCSTRPLKWSVTRRTLSYGV